jgi:hypothetical protein
VADGAASHSIAATSQRSTNIPPASPGLEGVSDGGSNPQGNVAPSASKAPEEHPPHPVTTKG